MKKTNKITILSTYTTDKLIDENGVLLDKRDGGPAFYLKQAFENTETPFVLKTGPKMEVQILITKDGEFGKIPKQYRSKKIRFSQIKTPLLVISSVLNEFELTNLSEFNGKVFLDVQGYVRDGRDFGKKKLWNPGDEVFTRIFCLKGTKEELENIPLKYIEIQKRKILIITNGKRGCEVFSFDQKYVVKPTKIVSCQDTIGAGDTFFAYFISYFITTSNVFKSIRFALKETSEFLSVKRNHHHNHLFGEEIGCG